MKVSQSDYSNILNALIDLAETTDELQSLMADAELSADGTTREVPLQMLTEAASKAARMRTFYDSLPVLLSTMIVGQSRQLTYEEAHKLLSLLNSLVHQSSPITEQAMGMLQRLIAYVPLFSTQETLVSRPHGSQSQHSG